VAAGPTPMNGPLGSALAQQVVRSLAARQQQGAGGPGGQGGPGGNDVGQQVSAQLSDLQGADPKAIVALLHQMKAQMVALIPQTAFRIPGVTRHLSKAMQDIDGALKEAQQALQASSTVGASPVGLSVARTAGGPPGPGPSSPIGG
jgi:hypothetical protein